MNTIFSLKLLSECQDSNFPDTVSFAFFLYNQTEDFSRGKRKLRNRDITPAHTPPPPAAGRQKNKDFKNKSLLQLHACI